jgi:hypothetical protein
MRIARLLVLVSCVLAFGLPRHSWAQATAQINGTVTDATGAAIPGAEVKATQTATGVSRTVISGSSGDYVLPNLQIGPYSLEVTKDGFSKYVQTGINLNVSDNPTIGVVLKVGNVAEHVEITAQTQMVETQNTGVSQVMTNTGVIGMPLNGRNPADLVQLTGAAVTLGATGNASSRSMQGVLGGEGYSIAGGQTSSVNYLLDGAWHNNAYDNLNMPLPFPDSLQEFKMETSALSAETGVHSGGTITAVTKSGTNEFHGDAFEFVRNLIFDARSPFAPLKNGQALSDGLKRNQFGGVVGGPVIKNKFFFFAGVQATYTRQQPAAVAEFVPTAQELAGDFTTVSSSACQAKPVTLGAPFVGNKISPSKFSPAALNITSRLPKSTDAACGSITFVQPVDENEYQVTSRADYHLSDKDSIFARYIYTSELKVPPFSLVPDVLATTLGGRDNLAQSAAVGETYLFNSSMVNSIHFALNRTAIHRTDEPYFDNNDVGINAYTYQPGILLMTVTGGFSLGNGVETQSTFDTDTYQLNDDFSWVKGKHQIAFGGTESHWISSSRANVRSPGVWAITGQTTGLGLSDFLTGNTANFSAAEPNTLFMEQWYTGLYAQDSWKVTPRLTVNYGLRWEPWFPQQITNGAIYNFSLTRFEDNVRSKTFPTAPPGLYFPGDPGFLGKAGQQRDLNDWEPRIGINWDPFGDGKTSVRAAYGIFYDFANGQFFINTTIAPPFGDEVIVNNANLDNPWNGYPGGNPFPVSTSGSSALFPLAAPYLAPTPNLPATQVHSWNLSIQRQLGPSWLVSANYIGNEVEHLWVSTQINPGNFIPGNCVAGQYGLTAPGPCSPASNSNLEQRRTLSILSPGTSGEGQFYGLVDTFNAGGTQSYEGVIFQVQHRLSKGYTLAANDTFSHCIGVYSQEFTTPNPGTGYQFPNDLRADRGNCIFDHRNLFNANGTYAVPRFNNTAERIAGSGWNFSLIWTYFSGDALLITTGTDQALNGNTATQRPTQVLANPRGTGFVTHYLNPAAFEEPAIGTYGNMGVYSARGPAVTNVNLAVYRVFPFNVLDRPMSFELRGEAFNLPNDYQRGDPITTLNTNTFGTVTSLAGGGPGGYNPRELQFSGKIVF